MLRELIKTDRLILRLFSLVDVEDILLYASDPEWARYLPVPPTLYESRRRKIYSRSIVAGSQNTRILGD